MGLKKRNTSLLFIYLIIAFLTLGFGCSEKSSPTHSFVSYQIFGRNQNSLSSRSPLYRIKAPPSWTHIASQHTESLADTTKSLSEFFIQEEEGTIRITVHNFPSETIESRIPPFAQIARWEQQFAQLDQTATVIIPQSFSGFVGLLFEGTGIINDEPTTMMGWSMQLDPIHYRTLSHPAYPSELRADVTIKALGPKNLMAKHYSAIYTFARSFELIDEIPAE